MHYLFVKTSFGLLVVVAVVLIAGCTQYTGEDTRETQTDQTKSPTSGNSVLPQTQHDVPSTGMIQQPIKEIPAAPKTELIISPFPESGLRSVDDEIQTLPDGRKYLIHPNDILSGGPAKDGIPSIDNPKYISVEEANEWIEDAELGMGITYKGEKRFYPFQILVWHEIVNDTIAGDPILITYCPLCGSGIAFNRKINGEAVEFGTSGKLYNSNLVMYDRKTETYWQQIEGKAIVGELVGNKLVLVPIDTITYGAWKRKNPETKVLSRETGKSRQYGRDPYGNYYTNESLYFPVGNEDNRLHAKAVVFGVEVNGEYAAYPESELKKGGTIEDTLGGIPIRLDRDDIGIITIRKTNSNEQIAYERDFWFAWFAFHPETKLFQLG
jgi:hypothetical protein